MGEAPRCHDERVRSRWPQMAEDIVLRRVHDARGIQPASDRDDQVVTVSDGSVFGASNQPKLVVSTVVVDQDGTSSALHLRGSRPHTPGERHQVNIRADLDDRVTPRIRAHRLKSLPNLQGLARIVFAPRHHATEHRTSRHTPRASRRRRTKCRFRRVRPYGRRVLVCLLHIHVQSMLNGHPMAYDHRAVEARWQAYWEQNRIFRAERHKGRPKLYALD